LDHSPNGSFNMRSAECPKEVVKTKSKLILASESVLGIPPRIEGKEEKIRGQQALENSRTEFSQVNAIGKFGINL
jgi:hypothetical protein